MKQFVLALDLQQDEKAISQYIQAHQAVWPEVEAQILASGICTCSIFRLENRLFMMLETTDDFTFERKAELDAGHQRTQEWEEWMSTFQVPVPGGEHGVKWRLMENIYRLEAQ